MSELRQDPTTREWVVIAANRGQRPRNVGEGRTQLPPGVVYDPDCPFCPGNERMAPPAIAIYGGYEANSWQARVVPNKYPIFSWADPESARDRGTFFKAMAGNGVHEVVVETPRHSHPMSRMDDGEISLVLRVYRDRYQALRRESGVKSILIFRNQGRAAGASLEHPHSQIVAASSIPPALRRREVVARAFFDETGRCLYDVLIDEESRAGTRIILESSAFIAFAPFASRVPFETWIVPRSPGATFGDITEAGLPGLANLLRIMLAKLRTALEDPAITFVVYSASSGEKSASSYRWHLVILPRLTTMGGFEWGAGTYVNMVTPEDAAESLRRVQV
jgi:UDPglucose--hexose-1-phosphate uridylyltransferase